MLNSTYNDKYIETKKINKKSNCLVFQPPPFLATSPHPTHVQTFVCMLFLAFVRGLGKGMCCFFETLFSVEELEVLANAEITCGVFSLLEG